MAQVTHPLGQRQTGAAVADLQEALVALAKRRAIRPDDARSRKALVEALAPEQEKKRFGAATRRLVAAFQEAHGLAGDGAVDEATARAMNALLDERPARSRTETPLLLGEGMSGDAVQEVQDALSGLGIRIQPWERERRYFGVSTRTAVEAWRAKNGLPADGIIDDAALKQLREHSRDLPRTVRGRIGFADGAPAGGLTVIVLDHDFRAKHELGRAVTDEEGHYRIRYSAASFAHAEKGAADIGLLILANDGRTVIAEPASADLLMNAPADAVIDRIVTVPEGATQSEFERIDASLRVLVGEAPYPEIGGRDALDEGIFLARESGFSDDRIAHFIVAHRVAEAANAPATWFYALLREDGLYGITPDRARAQLTPVGLASDTQAILFEAALLPAKTAAAAVDRAVRKSIVPAATRSLGDAATRALAPFADDARKHSKVVIGARIVEAVETVLARDMAGEVATALAALDPGDIAGLRDRLKADRTPADTDHPELNAWLELGSLLDFDGTLMTRVVEATGATGPDEVRKLAGLRPADWAKHVAAAAPDTGEGRAKAGDPHVRRQSDAIARRFETRFPTAALAATLSRTKDSALPEHKRVAEFLEAHPALELKEHRLMPFLKAAKIDAKAIEPEVKRGVEKLQRVMRLTDGSHRETEALLVGGYTASADIVAAGKTQFMADVRRAGGVSTAEATRIFELAESNNIATVTIAANLATLSQPMALAGQSAQKLSLQISQVLADQPDLAGLFGANDACDCLHCRSIYGPAAYFADVMRFLRDRLVKTAADPTLPGTRAAKEVLFARRPDLGEIDLNCDNALIEVPHIDIVCELAEEAIAPDAGFAFNGTISDGTPSAALLAAVRAHHPITDAAIIYGPYAANRFILRDAMIVLAIDGPGPNWSLRRLRQTHGTAEERAAAPEYVNAAAYQAIRTAKAAFGLPFDLFHAETRAYLAAAGIERAGLMTALAVGGAPPAAAIQAEALGLSEAERTLIFAAAVADQPAIWAVSGATATPVMDKLDVFTRKTGLDYKGVEELIAGRWVRGATNLFIRHLDNSCNLSEKEISGLSDAILDRMHRALRLTKKTGIAVADVDRLAMATKLGGGDLGDAALAALAKLRDISDALKVPLPRLISWLDTIPAHDSSKLFERPAVTGPLSPELTAVALAAHTAAPATAPLLTTVAGDLTIAFAARPVDVDAAIGRLTALGGGVPKLSSTSVAAVFARLGLARALGLDVARLVQLEQFAGVDALADAGTMAAFVRTAQAVIATGVPIPELAYRLERSTSDAATRDLADPAIATLLTDIRTRLMAVRAENASPFDPNRAPGEQIEALITQLGRQPQLAQAAIDTLVAPLREAAPSAAMGTAAKAVVDAPSDAATDAGLAGLVDEVAVKDAIDDVIATPGATEKLALLDALMGGLAQSTISIQSLDIARTAVAQSIAAPVDRTVAILDGARLTVNATPTRLITLFSEGDIVDEAIALTPASAPELYRAARLAHAIAGLVSPFEPSAATVNFQFANAATLGWLALDTLPFETTLPAIPAIPLAEWLEMVDIYALVAEYPAVAIPTQPGVTVDARQIFKLAADGVGKAQLLDALSVLTGWPRALLDSADTHLALAVADYRTPATWRRVATVIGLLNQLCVPLSEAVAYAQPTLGETDRRNAKRMLAARYDPADWLGTLKNIMDPIREDKRDALVAYLLATNPLLTGPIDLDDHFLTEMRWSAKMPSSRLVHAHGTLQSFIARCIAGLEPEAVADLDHDEAWKWWDWMRNYRVWEVGRKVFVEAQYYLRPEWRDDKTEPFEAMESLLLQNEINQENIEAAYEGYLDELDRIAFLDVLATCYDFDRELLHVFGATKGGDPRTYFHRTLKSERDWTPWRKIELDITGEHLIAFFRNKRLYLAWATFMEKGDEEQEAVFPEPNGSGTQPMNKSKRWSEIKLAISEYTGKKWLPRRVSEGFVKTPTSEDPLDQKRIFLTVTPGATDFTVDVCNNQDGAYLNRIGAFNLTGCKGYPEVVAIGGSLYVIPQFEDTRQRGQRLVEQDVVAGDRLAMMNGLSGGFATLFGRTPGTFRITYPFQASEIDQFFSWLLNLAFGSAGRDRDFRFFGTLMPFFFEDNRRGYVLVPGFYGKLDPDTGTRTTTKTFSNVRRLFLDVIAFIIKYLQLWAAATTPAEQQQVLDTLSADPERERLAAEFESYRGTDFGIVVRNFYHPLACFLRDKFFTGRIPLLLARSTQLHVGPFQFENAASGYDPAQIILPPYPREEMEFGREGAYSAYNWELTFHAPHMIAAKLIEAERFDEAEAWLRYIFDPLGSSNDPEPNRYWNTKPFFERGAGDYGEQLISAIMNRLASDPAGAIETELAHAVREWRTSPFKPYLVARSRTVAFQQAIVDLTIRLYVGRGDMYFRRDQLEDLVMASLDYARAERLLGPRPAIVQHAVTPPSETYNQLEAKLDLFGNALRTLENLLPDLSVLPQDGAELPPPPLSLESLYFCIPPSEKLYELWDRLEERQFNLRNSRTIDGVERSLSIFAPPLSVEELIKASAAGLSLSSILSSLSAPRPPYRFRVMLRHAIELTETAVGFSRQMEAALASRDTEGLAHLKIEQEIFYQKEQRTMLREEIKIAGGNISSQKKARQLHNDTKEFFEGRPYMNGWEVAATVANGISFGLQAVVAIGYAASGGLSLVPAFMMGAAGFGGSPTANVQISGEGFSSSARDFVVGAVGAAASALDKAAAMLDKQAAYLIRQEEWEHAAAVAKREVERADIEIAIAQIRETIAKEQLRLHGIRQQQTAAEQTYLTGKFTNRELFDWLSGQLRGLSRQMFNHAFEAAKAAERCFNFELGLTESFVRSGQWNDARHGLLAAENLSLDLRRMDGAYLKRNVREREMTKQISLARLDPLALLELRTTGRCTIQLPEALFDLDHPGQYFRRIKALKVTVPCVAGPYSSVPIKLTQTSNRIRISTAKAVGATTDAEAYAEAPGNDTRFKYNVGAIQTIETSHGQDDPALFALDFQDERYLPCEGNGLCGTFVVELPPKLRGLNIKTIADLVLTAHYTARDGGGGFRAMVANGLAEQMNATVLKPGRTGLFHACDVRRDKPDVWHRLVTTGTADLTVSTDDLPYFAAGRTVTVVGARLLAEIAGSPASFNMTAAGAAVTLNAPAEADLAGLLASSVAGVQFDTALSVSAPAPALMRDLVLMINYSIA